MIIGRNNKKLLKLNLKFFGLFITFLFCLQSYSDEQSKSACLYKGYITREPEIEKIYSAQSYDRYRITFSIENRGEKPWIGGLFKSDNKDKVYLRLRINEQSILEYVVPKDVSQGEKVNLPAIISIPKTEGVFNLKIGLSIENKVQFNSELVEVMKIENRKDKEGYLKNRFIIQAQGKELIIP